MIFIPICSFFVIAMLSIVVYVLSLGMEGDFRATKRAHGYCWFAIISMVYLAVNMVFAIIERLA